MKLPPIPSSVDYQTDPEVWDIIIVGAGVAGSSLAYAQGKDGRRVLLLERDLSQPDRIVGELLQPGGYLALKRLGLQHCVDGIDAQRVTGYALFKGEQSTVVGYPVDGLPKDVAGRSFHHGRFVQKLRESAAAVDTVTVREATVKRLINEEGGEWQEGEVVTGVAYKPSGEGAERTARAHLTIVCDGMYSGLRRHLSQPDIHHPSYFVGLLLRGVKLPHEGHGHVLLGNPAPVLFYPISSTEVRCLVDIPGPKLPSDLCEYLRTTVAPQVPAELREAFMTAAGAGDVRSMQNKILPAVPLHQPGALLLGDAFNMRHPLTGGGMTVALTDCTLLSNMLQPLGDLSDALRTARCTADFYTARKPTAATINTLANALYKVFSYSPEKAHEDMRQACFDYLAQGGPSSSGPMALLSGLNPSPAALVNHFYGVALFGVGRLLRPLPTPARVWAALMLLLAASRIIVPIIWAEGLRAVFTPSLAPRPLRSVRTLERTASATGSLKRSSASLATAAAANGSAH